MDKRFWSKVNKTPTCWLWVGAHSNGYGQFYLNGKLSNAHRVAYEMLIGDIPDGYVIDHLCKVRTCVNPKHLEPVTQRVNVLRGVGISSVNARKTHCKNGHEFTPSNTYTHRNMRTCRKCKNIKQNLMRKNGKWR